MNIEKAIEIKDAKISFVSLVDKAANLTTFLVAKGEKGRAQFSTYGKILKADQKTHYITGLVYEPMTEDAHGNYMTEDEIRKAAYWFAKNGDKVDLQHSFESADGLTVVENYVAPCDMTIGDSAITKGSWVITVECANDDVWQAVQKGKLTGFSMGGFGKYSGEETELDDVKKDSQQESAEKKGILKRLTEMLGLGGTEKSEEPVEKAGKKMSGRNKAKLDEICQALSDFKNGFDEDEEDPVIPDGKKKDKPEPIQKEEHEMTRQETETLISQCITKALTDAGIIKAAPAVATPAPASTAEPAPVQKDDKPVDKAFVPTAPQPAPQQPQQQPSTAPNNQEIMNQIENTVKAAVKSALADAGLVEAQPDPNAPVTKAEIESIVADAVAPMLKAFSVPTNLNDAGAPVVKNDEPHYLAGIL